MDSATGNAILDRSRELDQAAIAQGVADRPQSVQRISLKLDVEKKPEDAYIVNFGFKSFVVEGASDPTAFVFARPNTRDDVQSWFRMGYRDSWSVQRAIGRAFLHWPAQPGKTLDLIFFTDSEFRSGSQVSLTGGGTSLTDGAGGALNNPSIVAATSTIICAANGSRKVATIQNNSGASIYLGPTSTVSNAGVTRGIELGPSQVTKWRNTSALWAYSPNAIAAGGLTILEEA